MSRNLFAFALLLALSTLVWADAAETQEPLIPNIEVPPAFEAGNDGPLPDSATDDDALAFCTDVSQPLEFNIEYLDGGTVSDTIEYGRLFRVVVPFVPCPFSEGTAALMRVRLGAVSIFGGEFFPNLTTRDPAALDPRFELTLPGDPLPAPVDLVSDPILIAPFGWRGLSGAGHAEQRVPDAVDG